MKSIERTALALVAVAVIVAALAAMPQTDARPGDTGGIMDLLPEGNSWVIVDDSYQGTLDEKNTDFYITQNATMDAGFAIDPTSNIILESHVTLDGVDDMTIGGDIYIRSTGSLSLSNPNISVDGDIYIEAGGEVDIFSDDYSVETMLIGGDEDFILQISEGYVAVSGFPEVPADVQSAKDLLGAMPVDIDVNGTLAVNYTDYMGVASLGFSAESEITVSEDSDVVINESITCAGSVVNDGTVKVSRGGGLTIADLANSGFVYANDDLAITAYSGDGDVYELGDASVSGVDDVIRYVATVDGTNYTTIADALAAADGKTVTLLADYDSAEGAIAIPENVGITLDIAGHDWRICDDTSVTVSGELVLKDSTVGSEPQVDQQGNVDYGSGVVYSTNTVFEVVDGGVLEIVSGTVTISTDGDFDAAVSVQGNQDYTYTPDGVSNVTDVEPVISKVIVDGGYVLGYDYGITLVGLGATAQIDSGTVKCIRGTAILSGQEKPYENSRGACHVIVNSGNIVAVNDTITAGIHNTTDGDVTINGGSINVSGPGIIMRMGTLTVNGGNIDASGTRTGTIGSNHSVPSAAIVLDVNDMIVSEDPVWKVVVNEGDLSSDITVQTVQVIGDATDDMVDIFNGDVSTFSGMEDMLADGHVFDSEGRVLGYANIGDVNYGSLEKALEVADGETVTLNHDIVADSLEFDGQAVVDLNGFDITLNGIAKISGTLVLIDDSEVSGTVTSDGIQLMGGTIAGDVEIVATGGSHLIEVIGSGAVSGLTLDIGAVDGGIQNVNTDGDVVISGTVLVIDGTGPDTDHGIYVNAFENGSVVIEDCVFDFNGNDACPVNADVDATTKLTLDNLTYDDCARENKVLLNATEDVTIGSEGAIQVSRTDDVVLWDASGTDNVFTAAGSVLFQRVAVTSGGDLVIPESADVTVDDVISIGSGSTVQGRIAFGSDRSNAVVLDDVVVGGDGLDLTLGSVVMSGSVESGRLTLDGYGIVDGVFDLGSAVLEIPVGSPLIVPDGTGIQGESALEVRGDVMVFGTVSAPVENNGSVKVYDGGSVTGDVTGAPVVDAENPVNVSINQIPDFEIELGERLRVAVTVIPSDAVITAAIGSTALDVDGRVISWTPEETGTYTVTVTAEYAGVTDTVSFDVTVTEPVQEDDGDDDGDGIDWRWVVIAVILVIAVIMVLRLFIG